jgi:hypothetical protein
MTRRDFSSYSMTSEISQFSRHKETEMTGEISPFVEMTGAEAKVGARRIACQWLVRYAPSRG